MKKMMYIQAKELIAKHIQKNHPEFTKHSEYGAAFSHFIQTPAICPPFMDYNLFIECKGLILGKKIGTNGEVKKTAELAVEYQPYLQFVDEQIPFPPPKDPKFTFIDLFAGIGGFRLALQSLGGKCVFSSEWDKGCQETYEANFGEIPYGDIRKVNDNIIPEHDILCAGFPCQPFSHAGKKLGLEDTRGTLFFDVARIMKKMKPKVALLENVKGFKNHDKGRTLKILIEVMKDIGYEYKTEVLSSKDFGIPQNRQRIFIVLWRKELNKEFCFPESLNTKTRLGDILENRPEIKYTISDKLWEGHKRRKLMHENKGNGFGYQLFNKESPYAATISARYYKDGSEILIEQKGANPRKLTIREAARLQGFPENFILHKSTVQVYKQFGNSVTMPVVKRIAENVIHQLLVIS